MTGWLSAAAVYGKPRVLAILFLGFSSGLPLALTGQTLAVRLKEQGVSIGAIGLFALVGLPYVLKFLWAPLVDAVQLPLLTRVLGRRRSWLVASQFGLMAAIVVLGFHDPLADLWFTAALALAVAFCSATQDIVIDAFRIESLEEHDYAASMANYVAGYRFAMLISTFGVFEMVDWLQQSGGADGLDAVAWSWAYAAMAATLGIGTLVALLSVEPEGPRQVAEGLTARFSAAVVHPFVDFIARPDWLVVLLFVMLFKFGDAFAGVMTAPFVLDIGFDKVDYGRVVKLFGFAAVLIGGFLGGYVQRLFSSTLTSLWLAGILQMISNLMFVWLASVGADYGLLIAAIAIENLTGGFATVIFVAYLSGLCGNRDYTATQYALLSALSAVGRTVLSATSGGFAEAMGWAPFFLLSTVAAVPGLMLLWYLTRREKLEVRA